MRPCDYSTLRRGTYAPLLPFPSAKQSPTCATEQSISPYTREIRLLDGLQEIEVLDHRLSKANLVYDPLPSDGSSAISDS
jgi:hypothetical protein